MGQGTGSQSRMYRGVDTEQRRAERRERLLEAALDEFTSRGYHKTKIADLCARAGVSTRNFYEKFASKEALLLELHAHINTVAMKRMLPVLDALEDADALTRITTLVDAFVQAVTSDPRYPRLNYVEAPGISQAMERQHQDWFNRYTDFIEAECQRVVTAGLAPERDYHLTAIALVGAVTGILREWQAHEPPLPVQDVADEIRAMFLASITRPA
jgi:AcrR family transcriptional regulator